MLASVCLHARSARGHIPRVRGHSPCRDQSVAQPMKRQHATEDAELRKCLLTVFLTPESMDVLEKRLLKRNKDSSSTIAKRLAVARQEISQWKNFDYLIISTSIKEDLRRMTAIIDAEKMRQCRAKAPEF